MVQGGSQCLLMKLMVKRFQPKKNNCYNFTAGKKRNHAQVCLYTNISHIFPPSKLKGASSGKAKSRLIAVILFAFLLCEPHIWVLPSGGWEKKEREKDWSSGLRKDVHGEQIDLSSKNIRERREKEKKFRFPFCEVSKKSAACEWIHVYAHTHIHNTCTCKCIWFDACVRDKRKAKPIRFPTE